MVEEFPPTISAATRSGRPLEKNTESRVSSLRSLGMSFLLSSLTRVILIELCQFGTCQNVSKRVTWFDSGFLTGYYKEPVNPKRSPQRTCSGFHLYPPKRIKTCHPKQQNLQICYSYFSRFPQYWEIKTWNLKSLGFSWAATGCLRFGWGNMAKQKVGFYILS